METNPNLKKNIETYIETITFKGVYLTDLKISIKVIKSISLHTFFTFMFDYKVKGHHL